MFLVAISFVAVSSAQADPQIAAVQQALKDQGFYYGEITGTKDADTTAAIRRYQIRNGLQITGELNAETQKSLGVKGPAAAATPRPSPPARSATPPPDTSDRRDDEAVAPETPPSRAEPFPAEPVPRPGYAPGPRGLYPDTTGVFDDTPYEVAPPDLQRRVIAGAQTLLARRGYYGSDIDGIYGPEMEAALRAYQSRYALEPTGVLDMETLASLGLLPGQQRRGIGRRPRVFPPPRIIAPNGEPIYVPR